MKLLIVICISVILQSCEDANTKGIISENTNEEKSGIVQNIDEDSLNKCVKTNYRFFDFSLKDSFDLHLTNFFESKISICMMCDMLDYYKVGDEFYNLYVYERLNMIEENANSSWDYKRLLIYSTLLVDKDLKWINNKELSRIIRLYSKDSTFLSDENELCDSLFMDLAPTAHCNCENIINEIGVRLNNLIEYVNNNKMN